MLNHSNDLVQEQLFLRRESFGQQFQWGVATSAFQTEGAYNVAGKGLSIWDVFTARRGKVKGSQHAQEACNFYHRYPEDLQLMQDLAIPNFRFSISWPRLLPQGYGKINQAGIDYYNKLIDTCLEKHIQPWITLYHWDLPDALEQQGGWTNRNIVAWFEDYVSLCVKHFGDRVKHWMVLNEPMVFTGAGYFLGVHAPGRRGFGAFVPAVHHAALCQAAGARIIRQWLPGAEIGTTFSCSHIEPFTDSEKDRQAAIRVDALLNRLFVEPALGLGYPLEDLKFMRRIEKYMQAGDEDKLAFDFDFIGIQNYTREVVKYAFWTPFIQASLVSPKKRKVPFTLMNWEIYPEGIYHLLHKFSQYQNINKIFITENGAAFADHCQDGQVNDLERIAFLKSYLQQVLRAKEEGAKVDGYFVWSLLDNFEWAEGYDPRFGLIYVDFATQRRTIKASGYWYRDFLTGKV